MSKRNKISNLDIVLLVIGILLILGGAAGCYFLYDSVSKVVAEKQLKDDELQKLKLKAEQLPQLLEEIERLENEESRLIAFIPTKEEQAEFIWELENLAKTCDVTITKCTIQSSTKQIPNLPDYIIYPWDLTITGNFNGLTKFMDLVTKGKRSVMVSAFKVNSTVSAERFKEGYELKVDMNLDLITIANEKKVNQ